MADLKETFILDNNGNKVYGVWYTKKNCKKCYERGIIGREVLTNTLQYCSCLKFIKRKEEEWQSMSILMEP